MQGCLELPSLVDLTIYPMTLTEESVVSLRITICDTPRQMLTNVILLCILYMVCIKNKYSNNINNVSKKEKFHKLLLLLR